VQRTSRAAENIEVLSICSDTILQATNLLLSVYQLILLVLDESLGFFNATMKSNVLILEIFAVLLDLLDIFATGRITPVLLQHFDLATGHVLLNLHTLKRILTLDCQQRVLKLIVSCRHARLANYNPKLRVLCQDSLEHVLKLLS